MSALDDLNSGEMRDIYRRLKALETASPQNNAAIGENGLRVYGGGGIYIEDGKLVVASGSMTIGGPTEIDGALVIDGTTTVNGLLDINGPATVSGTMDINGATTVNDSLDINGSTTIDGSLVTSWTVRFTGLPTITGVISNLYIDPITGQLRRII